MKQPHSFRFVEDVIVLQGIWCPFLGGRKHVLHIAGTIFAIFCWKQHVLTGFGEVIPHPLATRPWRRNMSREISTWKPKRSVYAHVWSIYPTLSVLEDVFSVFFGGGCSRVHFVFSTFFFSFPPCVNQASWNHASSDQPIFTVSFCITLDRPNISLSIDTVL